MWQHTVVQASGRIFATAVLLSDFGRGPARRTCPPTCWVRAVLVLYIGRQVLKHGRLRYKEPARHAQSHASSACMAGLGRPQRYILASSQTRSCLRCARSSQPHSCALQAILTKLLIMAALPQAPPTALGFPAPDELASEDVAAEQGVHPLQSWIYSGSASWGIPWMADGLCRRVEHCASYYALLSFSTVHLCLLSAFTPCLHRHPHLLATCLGRPPPQRCWP